jgi:hypothetical protein
LLFPILGPAVLGGMLHNIGTLPPGNYPRLDLTFLFPAMLANYLSVSLMLLLIGEHLGWFSRRTALVIAPLIVIAAFFALTPGFGGLLFGLGTWIWLLHRDRHPLGARIALITGCVMALIGVILASVTPIMHSTAPFLIHLPGFPPLAPSVRFLAWTEALQNFAASPAVGRGWGVDTVDVNYQASGCGVGCVTDAHNTFLNVAVQSGTVGIAALGSLIWFVARPVITALRGLPTTVLLAGLAIAWLSGVAVQGLVGSFEDARHLWVMFGLILVASRPVEIEACTPLQSRAKMPPT